MMTPWVKVRFQCLRHQAMSYCCGSDSVMLVWPQRKVRRYHGPSGGVEDFFSPPRTVEGILAAIAAVSRHVCLRNARRGSTNGTALSFQCITRGAPRRAEICEPHFRI